MFTTTTRGIDIPHHRLTITDRISSSFKTVSLTFFMKFFLLEYPPYGYRGHSLEVRRRLAIHNREYLGSIPGTKY